MSAEPVRVAAPAASAAPLAPPTAAAPPTALVPDDDPALPDRQLRESMRLAQRQVGRIPLPYLLIDSFLCWLLLREGLTAVALGSLLVMLVVQLWRWDRVRRFQPDTMPDPAQAIRLFSRSALLLGILRAAVLPFLFQLPVGPTHYMVSMVYLGMIAATSASVGGQLQAFVAYCGVVGGGLALAWASTGTGEGLWLGVLILCLMVVLSLHLRDQIRGQRQLVTLALANERISESLRQAVANAEAASRSKVRFFAAASHDLRQPLHALSINATLLQLLASRQGNRQIQDVSQAINRALAQGNGLLDSLLEISNLDADAVAAKPQPVDLAALLGGVREEFAPLAAQKGLQLTLALPQGVPLAAHTDPTLLRRILINLVGNALKFTTEGRVTIGATSQAAAGAPATIKVWVLDTGPGIPASEQQRVFEEFYQLSNTARDRSLGLGLGLAIVQRIAHLLGTRPVLDSSPGQGTCITIDLPVARALPPAPEAVPVVLDLDKPGLLTGLRVLAIDDEAEIRASMHALLTQLGCQARCVGSHSEAEALLDQGFVPQLLVADQRLRGELGTDVVRALRARLGPLPTVLVTGDTEPGVLRRALDEGHQVVHKPVQGPRLAQVLAELAQAAGLKPTAA